MKMKNKKNIIEIIAEEKQLTIVKHGEMILRYSHTYPTVEQMQAAKDKYIGNRQAEGYRMVK